MSVKAIFPWIRSVIAFPLGLFAIQLFHAAGRQLVPMGYGALASDRARWVLLALATMAGIFGSFIVGAVARHRLWLHMMIFLAVMLVIDVGFLRTVAAAQPVWFKALVIAALPLQVWVGARLAMLTIRPGVPMRYTHVAVLMVFLLSATSTIAAQDQHAAKPAKTEPAEWFGLYSPIAVISRIEGDRTKAGAFSEYLRTPAGTSFAAHRHTADMHIRVISGRQFILMGDLETARVQRFDAGSSFVIRAGVWHVEWFEADTLVEISGVGPMKTERPPSVQRMP